MRRREFITLLGGASAAWPLAVRAQQPALPVIGFLNAASPKDYGRQLSAFLKGLSEAGYVDGQNVAIEYHWADGQDDRLPVMAADLVHRQVAVIAATTTAASLAAKAATTTIPIVFETGADPVQLGIVPNLNHPGGNITGVTQTNQEVTPKRLQFLHELVPTASIMALLANPASHYQAETQSSAALSAAHTLGLELHVLNASTESEIDTAFATIVQQRDDALVVATDPFLLGQRDQLVRLAARYNVPTIYFLREFVEVGGLMSYGPNIANGYRQAGVYTGQVLGGANPATLPVMQPTQFVLFLNLKTAKELGITVPPTLLALADEVIE